MKIIKTTAVELAEEIGYCFKADVHSVYTTAITLIADGKLWQLKIPADFREYELKPGDTIEAQVKEDKGHLKMFLISIYEDGKLLPSRERVKKIEE